MKKAVLLNCFFGAGNRTRTDDLRITNALLYQLSHTSILFCALLFYKKTGFLSTLIFYVTIKNNHKKGGAV